MDYYKHACRVLRLLDEDNALTAAGEQIAALTERTLIASLRVQFETSRCGWRWISWSNGKTLADVDPTTAQAFLVAVALV